MLGEVAADGEESVFCVVCWGEDEFICEAVDGHGVISMEVHAIAYGFDSMHTILRVAVLWRGLCR